MNTIFNKNNAKTVALLATLSGALIVVGSVIGGRSGASIGLILGLVMVGGSYWFSDKLAVRAAGAQPVQPGELVWLQDDLARLAQRAGIAAPRLYISPSMQPNAFATGRNSFPVGATLEVARGIAGDSWLGSGNFVAPAEAFLD